MKYPHVRYAIYIRGLTQQRFAHSVGMSVSRFSRCGRGILRFSTEERQRIARALGYEERWLFDQPRPRSPKALHAAEEQANVAKA